jgi:hypothetical protein
MLTLLEVQLMIIIIEESKQKQIKILHQIIRILKD